MAVELDDVRALVGDEDEVAFTDEALEAAIAASGDSILRAAGIAFTTLAATYAALGRSVATDDLRIDTTKRGSTLLDVAKSFLAEADAADASAGADFFEIVPFGGRASACRVEGATCPVGCNCCGGW